MLNAPHIKIQRQVQLNKKSPLEEGRGAQWEQVTLRHHSRALLVMRSINKRRPKYGSACRSAWSLERLQLTRRTRTQKRLCTWFRAACISLKWQRLKRCEFHTLTSAPGAWASSSPYLNFALKAAIPERAAFLVKCICNLPNHRSSVAFLRWARALRTNSQHLHEASLSQPG